MQEVGKEKQINFSSSELIFCPLLPDLTVSVSPSSVSQSFPVTFKEQDRLEHKEGQTDQSNGGVKELWPTRRSGSEVREDNGCRVGGNFLPQGTGECVVCVYTLSGVSIYSGGDPGQNTKHGNLLPDGRWHLF